MKLPKVLMDDLSHYFGNHGPRDGTKVIFLVSTGVLNSVFDSITVGGTKLSLELVTDCLADSMNLAAEKPVRFSFELAVGEL
jgi:hypothetical protein